MRQFLRRKLGLPSRVLAGSNPCALVLGAGALHRLAPPDEAAFAGAVDLTVVAGVANVDFDLATRAAEKTMAVDHLSPAGDVSGHGPGVERCSTSERRVDHRDDPEGSG
jgi:hypothetical protein